MSFLFKKVVAPILIIIFLSTTLLGGMSFTYADTETTYFYLHDHLGSVDTVLDNEGNVVERRDYLPYGEERLEVIEDIEHPELYESESYGYTDKELDDETGLMYYSARYYDPVIGRFISVDPLVLDEAQKSEQNLQEILQNPQMLNAYTYALNNPVQYTDPSGEIPIIGIAIAVVSELLTGIDTIYEPDEELSNQIATTSAPHQLEDYNPVSASLNVTRKIKYPIKAKNLYSKAKNYTQKYNNLRKMGYYRKDTFYLLRKIEWSKTDKPKIENQNLRSIIDSAYDSTNIADSVRIEKCFGRDDSGEIAGNIINQINNELNSNDLLSDNDRISAMEVRNDIESAVNDKTN